MRTPLLVALAACLASPGCFLRRAASDLDEFGHAVTLRGRVQALGEQHTPIVVMLVAEDGETGERSILRSNVRYGSGPFEFLAPPGNYALLAFEDRNQDLTFQPDECAGVHLKEFVHLEAGSISENLDIDILPAERANAEFPKLYEAPETLPPIDPSKERLGEVVTIDDPRFAPEIGTLGMWEPVRYYKEGHNGIYFLEPFDADKIPVLFVHGIKGSGSQFRALIEHLDRDRYQPWIVQYASGFRLELVAERLAQALVQLRLKHKFDRLHVVAHSMGGLVSRGTLNALHRDGHTFVDLYVTYSTPWGGHAAARSGVEWSPVVLPVWLDMVPESPYLARLFAQPLPEHLPHWLAFSFRGDPGLFVDEQNDGVVTIKSQLRADAQRGAVRITGFDEDHATILTCDAGLAFLAEALASLPAR